jgi:citrate lyase subunit beta/citryl-CoA lyase
MTTPVPARVRIERSEMATPGSNWSMIEKAVTSAADVVFLDLEDSVAPDQKVAARENVVRAVNELDWGTKPRLFRMNALDTPYFYRDLVDVVERCGQRLDLVLVPKVNRPEDVYVVETLLTQIEASTGIRHRIGLEVQIETAEGLINCDAIARASPRIEALIYGPGDYSASVRMPSVSIGTPDEWDAAYPGHRYQYVMHRLLVAARAAGIRVLDGPFANFRDLEGYRRSCLLAKSMGYDGKWCIHPGQIATANEVFSPSEEEVAWAQQVIDAYERATAEGLGAITVDGKMVDAASIKVAENTLAQARAAGMLS